MIFRKNCFNKLRLSEANVDFYSRERVEPLHLGVPFCRRAVEQTIEVNAGVEFCLPFYENIISGICYIRAGAVWS